jgi:hypothetical protein
LNPNGYLILTFPYTEHKYERNVYELSDSSYGQDLPFICQSFSRKELDKWMKDNDGIISDQEYWRLWEGEYWTEGKQIIPPRQVSAVEKHQLTCILTQKKA